MLARKFPPSLCVLFLLVPPLYQFNSRRARVPIGAGEALTTHAIGSGRAPQPIRFTLSCGLQGEDPYLARPCTIAATPSFDTRAVQTTGTSTLQQQANQATTELNYDASPATSRAHGALRAFLH